LQSKLDEQKQAARVGRIAAQYARKYPWADHEMLTLTFRLENVRDALRRGWKQLQRLHTYEDKDWPFGILRALYISPRHQLSHADISNETRIPPANLTYQIASLERAGYIVRSPHPSDRRITLVQLTEKGTDVSDRLMPARARFISNLGKLFTTEEKETLNRLLERLEEAVNSTEFEILPDETEVDERPPTTIV